MPRLARPKVSVRSFWTGLAGLAFAFALSMGGLNAWQLSERGVQVQGPDRGSMMVMVDDCGRDPLTLWQGWRCTGRIQVGERQYQVKFASTEPHQGAIQARVFGGPTEMIRSMQIVPEGTDYVESSMMPTDVAAIIWLVGLVVLPLVLAIGGGVQRTRGENRFDELASGWDDDPTKAERAQQVAAAIIERTSPGGSWLDYGAGTGALGLSLLGHADHITLADSSAGMLDAAEAKIAEAGLGDRASVQPLDLSIGAPAALRRSFDGVVSLLALHHIDDVEQTVERLAGLLRPGGWLALSDLDAEDGSFHGEHSPHAHHHGFDRAQIAEWMAGAGLGDIELSTPWQLTKQGREYPLFLAIGRLPKA